MLLVLGRYATFCSLGQSKKLSALCQVGKIKLYAKTPHLFDRRRRDLRSPRSRRQPAARRRKLRLPFLKLPPLFCCLAARPFFGAVGVSVASVSTLYGRRAWTSGRTSPARSRSPPAPKSSRIPSPSASCSWRSTGTSGSFSTRRRLRMRTAWWLRRTGSRRMGCRRRHRTAMCRSPAGWARRCAAHVTLWPLVAHEG